MTIKPRFNCLFSKRFSITQSIYYTIVIYHNKFYPFFTGPAVQAPYKAHDQNNGHLMIKPNIVIDFQYTCRIFCFPWCKAFPAREKT